MAVAELELPELSIPPFYTMEMMRYAHELERVGKTVYHLEVGQSVAKTPAAVMEEAALALREKPLNYCSALGLLELREAIVKHYEHAYQLKINLDSVVISPGSSLALYVALVLNFTKSARIAIASPSYPCYRNVIRSLGFTLVEIPTKRENNYLLTAEQLSDYQNIDGILVASPNNPTGSMYDDASLQALAQYCENKRIKILSDELYHGITYGDKATSILKYNLSAIVINGFSKYFCMTGWRVAWMIVPQETLRRYETFLQNMLLCTSPLNQYAAVKAFAYPELDANVTMYEMNRNILYDALTDAGLSQIYKPAGGFYIYVELEKCRMDSLEFCKKLLYEENVAVSPGMDFSSASKSCDIRLSFCQSQNVVEYAADKLNNFIKNW